MRAVNRYLKRLHARIKDNRGVFILYTALRLMVLAALIRGIIIGNYESAAICLLTFALFLIPSFLEGALRVEIAPLFEGIIYFLSLQRRSWENWIITTPPFRSGTPCSTP